MSGKRLEWFDHLVHPQKPQVYPTPASAVLHENMEGWEEWHVNQIHGSKLLSILAFNVFISSKVDIVSTLQSGIDTYNKIRYLSRNRKTSNLLIRYRIGFELFSDFRICLSLHYTHLFFLSFKGRFPFHYYVHIICSAWVFTKQWNTLRFPTRRRRWKRP